MSDRFREDQQESEIRENKFDASLEMRKVAGNTFTKIPSIFTFDFVLTVENCDNYWF